MNAGGRHPADATHALVNIVDVPVQPVVGGPLVGDERLGHLHDGMRVSDRMKSHAQLYVARSIERGGLSRSLHSTVQRRHTQPPTSKGGSGLRSVRYMGRRPVGLSGSLDEVMLLTFWQSVVCSARLALWVVVD